MGDEVDELRAALGADTDLGLAAKLGLERSTIAQWRRRGAVPARYRFMMKPEHRDSVRRGMKHADRRQIYGDGQGEFLLRAALAVIPSDQLDFPELSPALLGDHRESVIMNVVSVILNVCHLTLGKPRINNEHEYDKLVAALSTAESRQRIARALLLPSLGERS